MNTDDKLFYNVSIRYEPTNLVNDGSDNAVALKNISTKDPILTNINRYDFCISKFRVDTQTIPLIIPELRQPQEIVGNKIDLNYWVKLYDKDKNDEYKLVEEKDKESQKYLWKIPKTLSTNGSFKIKKPLISYSEPDKQVIKYHYDDNAIYAANEDGSKGDLLYTIIINEDEKKSIIQTEDMKLKELTDFYGEDNVVSFINSGDKLYTVIFSIVGTAIYTRDGFRKICDINTDKFSLDFGKTEYTLDNTNKNVIDENGTEIFKVIDKYIILKDYSYEIKQDQTDSNYYVYTKGGEKKFAYDNSTREIKSLDTSELLYGSTQIGSSTDYKIKEKFRIISDTRTSSPEYRIVKRQFKNKTFAIKVVSGTVAYEVSENDDRVSFNTPPRIYYINYPFIVNLNTGERVWRIVNDTLLYTVDGKFDGYILNDSGSNWYIYSKEGIVGIWNDKTEDISDDVNGGNAFTALKNSLSGLTYYKKNGDADYNYLMKPSDSIIYKNKVSYFSILETGVDKIYAYDETDAANYIYKINTDTSVLDSTENPIGTLEDDGKNAWIKTTAGDIIKLGYVNTDDSGNKIFTEENKAIDEEGAYIVSFATGLVADLSGNPEVKFKFEDYNDEDILTGYCHYATVSNVTEEMYYIKPDTNIKKDTTLYNIGKNNLVTRANNGRSFYFVDTNKKKIEAINGASLPTYYFNKNTVYQLQPVTSHGYINNLHKFCYIYEAQEFVDIINTALMELYKGRTINVKGNDTNIHYPFFNIDGTRLKFYQDKNDPYLLVFSPNLYRFFGCGFNIKYVDFDEKNTWFIANSLATRSMEVEGEEIGSFANPVEDKSNYNVALNQFSLTQAWNDCKAILVCTNDLPIAGEYLYISENDGLLIHDRTNYNMDLYRSVKGRDPLVDDTEEHNKTKVLESYYPMSGEGGDICTGVVYSNTNLEDNSKFTFHSTMAEIKKFDVTIKWLDYYNNIHDLELRPGSSCDVRFCFLKKPVKQDLIVAGLCDMAGRALPSAKRRKMNEMGFVNTLGDYFD